MAVGQIYEEPTPQIIINSGGNEKEDWQSQLIKIGLIIAGVAFIGICIVALVIAFSILTILGDALGYIGDLFGIGGGGSIWSVFNVSGVTAAPFVTPLATSLLSIFIGGRN